MRHPYGFEADQLSLPVDVVARHAADVDSAAASPRRASPRSAQGGLLGLSVSTELGGLGQGPRAFCVVAEELARACASTAMVYVMHVTAAQAIAASKTLADRDALLREIAAGKHLTTLALLGEGLALAVLGAGVEAGREGRRLRDRAPRSRGSPRPTTPTPTSRARRRPARSRRSSRRSTSCARARRGSRSQSGFDGLGLRGNDSAPVSLEGLAVAKRRPAHASRARAPTRMLGRDPALVRDRHRGHGERPLPRRRRRHGAAPRRRPASSTRARSCATCRSLRARLAQMSVRTEQSRALLGHTLGADGGARADDAALRAAGAARPRSRRPLDVTDLAMKACGGAAFSPGTCRSSASSATRAPAG